MKNLMSLKSRVHNKAKELNLPPQLILQNYMLGRFLARLVQSRYRKNFVLKGGFLIGSLVGIGSRTTMDIDGTIQDFPVQLETVKSMISDILAVKANDNVSFEMTNVQEIRKSDIYKGFRISLKATFETLWTPLTVDLTTGDEVYPHAIEVVLTQLLEEDQITIWSYPIETILAEKMQTILSRGDQNTRPRDFYDMFILWHHFRDRISIEHLRTSFEKTAKHRNTEGLLNMADVVLDSIESSTAMGMQWEKYRKTFSYASCLEFKETLTAIQSILALIRQSQ